MFFLHHFWYILLGRFDIHVVSFVTHAATFASLIRDHSVNNPPKNVSGCCEKQSFMTHSLIAHWTNWYTANKRRSYMLTLTHTQRASHQCAGLLLCSSAICLSAVGPCYLLYPFLPCSFTNPRSLPAVLFTISFSEKFSTKVLHRERDPSLPDFVKNWKKEHSFAACLNSLRFSNKTSDFADTFGGSELCEINE